MVFEMVSRRELERFTEDEPYDEFGFEEYCANGFKFVARNEAKPVGEESEHS